MYDETDHEEHAAQDAERAEEQATESAPELVSHDHFRSLVYANPHAGITQDDVNRLTVLTTADGARYAVPLEPSLETVPVARVLTGELTHLGPTDTHVMVTLWGDGTAEIATRDSALGTWSAPSPITDQAAGS